MPLFARAVLYGIAATLVAWALFIAWDVSAHLASVWSIWLSLLCMVAVVGLLRRVAWGRFMVSLISVLSALSIAANLIPTDDDFHSNSIVLKHWLGFMPSVWLTWVLVVGCSVPVLLPAVAIGWRKNWFRNAWW